MHQESIAFVALIALAATPALATAADADAAQVPAAATVAKLDQWVVHQVPRIDGVPLRIEVSVGRLSPSLRLAECTRAEPFIPPGTRMWGRTHFGLRCVEGARWTTWVPVKVSAWGIAAIARENLPGSTALDAGQFEWREVDWAATGSAPFGRAEALQGRELVRPLNAGAVLVQDNVRTTPAIRAGDPVQLHLKGNGFSIGANAVALFAASDGQPVRVRTDTGKVLTGKVDGKSVIVYR